MNRKVLLFIFIFISFNGFSQWYQLTKPDMGYCEKFSGMRPLADGKLAFSTRCYKSPSSGTENRVYISDDDLKNYSCVKTMYPFGMGSHPSLSYLNAFNDSSICYMGYVIAPFISYTNNRFQTFNSYGYPSQFYSIRSHCMLRDRAFAIASISGDTVVFMRSTITNTTTYYFKFNNYTNGTDIQFINDTVGLFIARSRSYPSQSVLLRTEDGGQNWTEVSSDSFNQIKLFSFVSENNGYMLKSNDKIFKTSNGGQNWEEVNSPIENSMCLKFYDKNVGYCGGSAGQLWKTIDGASSWTLERTNCSNDIISVYTFSNDVAYFSDSNGSIYKNNADFIPVPTDDIVVWPVPSSEVVTVVFKGSKDQPSTFKLYNVEGKEVLARMIEAKEGNSSGYFDVDDLPTGVYVLNVHTPDNVYSKRIIVKH